MSMLSFLTLYCGYLGIVKLGWHYGFGIQNGMIVGLIFSEMWRTTRNIKTRRYGLKSDHFSIYCCLNGSYFCIIKKIQPMDTFSLISKRVSFIYFVNNSYLHLATKNTLAIGTMSLIYSYFAD